MMIDLDEYRRAGLDEDVDAVLAAATRWRDDPTTNNVMALREAIDALAVEFVAFNEAVDEYAQPDDRAPGELRGGKIVL